MVAMICMKALLKLSSLVSLMVDVNTVMLSRYSYLKISIVRRIFFCTHLDKIYH